MVVAPPALASKQPLLRLLRAMFRQDPDRSGVDAHGSLPAAFVVPSTRWPAMTDADLGLVEKATAEARIFAATPQFKLYLLNSEELFFAFYPIVEHTVRVGRKQALIFDSLGKDAVLFHHAVTDDEATAGGKYVEQVRTWFDSVWNTVAREWTP